jgi:ribonuclease R
MAGFKDKNFEGRISYLSFGGVYVKLNNGSEGVIPMESLPRDYYMLDPHGLKMTGRKTGKQFHLGENMMVTLRESNAASGRILLSMIELDTDMKNKGKTHRDHGKRRKR